MDRPTDAAIRATVAAAGNGPAAGSAGPRPRKSKGKRKR